MLPDTRYHATDASSKEFLPLLDLVTACVVDSCCSRIDWVHEALSALLVTVARYHGAEAPLPVFHGMHPMTLYRCVDCATRSYHYYCRRKVYASHMLNFPESLKLKDDAKHKVRTF